MSRYRQSMREALQEVGKSEVLDEAVKWEVKISGLPMFYVDGKSRGAVRQTLRKMLKRPDDIASIERTTSTELKKIRRGQAQGQEPGEANEEVEDAYDYKAKKGAIAAPGSGSIAKAKKAKASDVNKSIEQQMKDALKEKLSIDDVVNMIQFGKPFKVVGEDIPATLPPGDPNFPKYKDIPNSVVDKEDKKANKVKDKVAKVTLVPTQTQEGKMEEFHALIKQGKSADEIAKTLDLDTQTVKELMPEATAAELELANAKKADKKQQGGSLKHKIWPASASMRMPKLEDAVSKVLEQEGGVTDDSGYTRYPSSGNWAGIKGKTYKKNLAKAKTKQTSQDKARDASMKMGAVPGGRAEETAQAKDAKDQDKDPVGKIRKESVNRIAERLKKKVNEVAPPGWGHTKAEKEKTKPNKPKSKIGGSAHEFQKDLDSGKFKGLPGDKTYKDKKASMFKLMWSMKDKGDKPHYKPGVKDVLKKKYKKEDSQDLPGLGPLKKSVKTSKRVSQIYTGAKVTGEENLLDSAKRYLEEKADWNTAFKSAAQSRPAMKYKDAVSFIDTAGLNSTEKRSALKAAKKWLR